MFVHVARPIDHEFHCFQVNNVKELVDELKKKWMHAFISQQIQLCHEETMEPFVTLPQSFTTFLLPKLKNGMRFLLLLENEIVPFQQLNKYNLRSSVKEAKEETCFMKRSHTTASLLTLDPSPLKKSKSFNNLFLQKNDLIEIARGLAYEYPWKNRQLESTWRKKSLIQTYS